MRITNKKTKHLITSRRHSVVGMVTGVGAGVYKIVIWYQERDKVFPKRQHQNWAPVSPFFEGFRRGFPRTKEQTLTLATH
jgi:hypothetical protein